MRPWSINTNKINNTLQKVELYVLWLPVFCLWMQVSHISIFYSYLLKNKKATMYSGYSYAKYILLVLLYQHYPEAILYVSPDSKPRPIPSHSSDIGSFEKLGWFRSLASLVPWSFAEVYRGGGSDGFWPPWKFKLNKFT